MPITAEINEIVQETPPEIRWWIVWCNKNFLGWIFCRKFLRKWTGNIYSIFQPNIAYQVARLQFFTRFSSCTKKNLPCTKLCIIRYFTWFRTLIRFIHILCSWYYVGIELPERGKNLSFKSRALSDGEADFKIMFKCMSGFTTENDKYILPLQEKLSYKHAFDRCDRFGFTNHF